MTRRDHRPISHLVDAPRVVAPRTRPCATCGEPAGLYPALRQVGWRVNANGRMVPETEHTDYARCNRCGWDEGDGTGSEWQEEAL